MTLIKSNPLFKKKRDELFKDFFQINNPIEEVSAKIRHFDLFCNESNETSGMNLNTNEIYCMILNSLGINFTDLNKLEQFYGETELLFMHYKPTYIDPETNSFLNHLHKEELTMSILSNTAFIKGTSLRKLLAYYEIEQYFSFQIYSDECGFSKPNHEIFEIVFNEANKVTRRNKEDILHIGDNPRADYHGAINYGFNAKLINN